MPLYPHEMLALSIFIPNAYQNAQQKHLLNPSLTQAYILIFFCFFLFFFGQCYMNHLIRQYVMLEKIFYFSRVVSKVLSGIEISVLFLVR